VHDYLKPVKRSYRDRVMIAGGLFSKRPWKRRRAMLIFAIPLFLSDALRGAATVMECNSVFQDSLKCQLGPAGAAAGEFVKTACNFVGWTFTAIAFWEGALLDKAQPRRTQLQSLAALCSVLLANLWHFEASIPPAILIALMCHALHIYCLKQWRTSYRRLFSLKPC